MSFGNRLRVAITQHHEISLSEFARRTGFSLPNLSHILTGQRKPGLDTLIVIINALPGTNIGWLITGEPK